MMTSRRHQTRKVSNYFNDTSRQSCDYLSRKKIKTEVSAAADVPLSHVTIDDTVEINKLLQSLYTYLPLIFLKCSQVFTSNLHVAITYINNAMH